MPRKISTATVRADFNDPLAVVHYARAAHFLGLWASELALIQRFFPDKSGPLLEAGCGAGRATIGLWDQGYRALTAFDFASELLNQARQLANDRGASAIKFVHADATAAATSTLLGYKARRPAPFAGAFFLFNGLMQIPRRAKRRAALRMLHRVCRPDAPFLFTTHDRDGSPTERALWRLEAGSWERGEQDSRLHEFGDRYFEEAGTGRTFMHLPDRAEILADLVATGWTPVFDAMRREIARESAAVRDFSDECRFWVARRN